MNNIKRNTDFTFEANTAPHNTKMKLVLTQPNELISICPNCGERLKVKVEIIKEND